MSVMKAPMSGELGVGDGEIPVEIVETTALAQIVKSETDMQITTAKRYPRNVTNFIRAAESMVTFSQEIAQGCWYTLTRKGQDGKNVIEGPSIRLAEIVASCWGNIRIAGRIIDDDGKMVTAQGFCWDLERNLAISIEVKRRVTTKEGRRYGDDMIVVTMNAALAIAIRNAIFKIIPRIYVNQLMYKAQAVVAGDIKDLGKRREEWVNYFKGLKVTEKELFGLLEVKSKEDITLEHVVAMVGIKNSLKDNEVTVDQIFRSTDESPPSSPINDRIKEKAAAAPNGNGHKEKPAESEPKTEPVKVEAETPKEQTPASKFSKEELLNQVNDLLNDFLPGTDPEIGKERLKAVIATWPVRSISQIERLSAADLDAGIPKLKAYLDKLPDA